MEDEKTSFKKIEEQHKKDEILVPSLCDEVFYIYNKCVERVSQSNLVHLFSEYVLCLCNS